MKVGECAAMVMSLTKGLRGFLRPWKLDVFDECSLLLLLPLMTKS